MSGSKLDGPSVGGDKGHVEVLLLPRSRPCFLGLGVPSVDPPPPTLRWPGRGWSWKHLPSPKPRRGQRAAGASRAGGRGQARACMLKDPQLPAVSRPWRQNLAFRHQTTVGHQTTVDQAVHPLAVGGGDKVVRSVLAGVGLPEKSTSPAGKRVISQHKCVPCNPWDIFKLKKY